MPPKANAAQSPAPTKLAVDTATHSVILKRSLKVPPERAFAAWTKPEQIAEWWDASGRRLKDCRVDLRVGGRFAFVTDQSAGPHEFGGTYKVIEPAERLVFEAMGAVGTVLFEASPGGTALTVTIRCASAEHLQQFLAMGVDAGTSQTLDNLVAFLG